MLNTQDKEVTMRAKYSEIPGLKEDNAYLVHDMWTRKDLRVFRSEFSVHVTKHDTVALRFTAADG